jgi:hypothetical protein
VDVGARGRAGAALLLVVACTALWPLLAPA